MVCRRPVTIPASIPAANAKIRETHGFISLRISITATAPPVAKEPSTDRSAKSRSLYVIYTPNARRPQISPCAMEPGSARNSASGLKEAK